MDTKFKKRNTKVEIMRNKYKKNKIKDEETIDLMHSNEMKKINNESEEIKNLKNLIEKLTCDKENLESKVTVNKKILNLNKQLEKITSKIEELNDGNVDSLKKEKLDNHIIEIEYGEINVQKELDSLINEKHDLEEKISKLSNNLQKRKMISEIEEKIDFYKIRLNSLKTNNSKIKYFKNTKDLLLDYDKKKVNDTTIIDLNSTSGNYLKDDENILMTEKFSEIIKGKKVKNNEIICEHCNEPKIIMLNEGVAVCKMCSESTFVLLDPEKPNYKDQTYESKGNPYVRLSHCTEVLNQYQGKESTNITEEDLDQIRNELKIRGVKDLKNLNRNKIKYILKSIGKSNLAERSIYIIHRLNGIPVNTYGKNLENLVKYLYKEAEEGWIHVKSKKEKNLVNTCFLFRKIFEMIGRKDIAKTYPKLSKGKDVDKERVWERICEYKGWTEENFINIETY